MTRAAHAAITTALADGMQRGVLLYETDTGVGRVPIDAGMATVRGLVDLAHEELHAEE